MKKFTLIIALCVVMNWVYAGENSPFQKKILDMKARTDLVLQHTDLSKNPFSLNLWTTANPGFLKSAEMVKLDSLVTSEYDKDLGEWENEYKTAYTYDAQMRNTVWTDHEWDSDTKSWEIWDKTENSFAADGKISSMISSSYDETSQKMGKDSKMEFFFSSDGKLDSTHIYSYESETVWELEGKQIYHYDGAGRLTEIEMWVLEDDDDGNPTGALMLGTVSKYEYNGAGQITKASNHYKIDGQEMLFSQTEYSYNAAGKLLSEINWSMSFTTFVLEKNNMTEYDYNPAGDVSYDIYFDWDAASDTWKEIDKYEYHYGSKDFSEIVYPTSVGVIFGLGNPSYPVMSKILLSDKSYEKVGEDWIEYDKTVYYYSGGSSVNVEDLGETEFSFFPNPVANDVTIRWNGNQNSLNLQIFQVSGVKVLEQNAFSDEKISVSHLVKGMYLLKLSDGQRPVYMGKMLKN